MFLAFKPYDTRQSIEQDIVQIEKGPRHFAAKGTRRLKRFMSAIMIRRDIESLTFAKIRCREVWVELSTEERKRYQDMKEDFASPFHQSIIKKFPLERGSGVALYFLNQLRLFCNFGVSSRSAALALSHNNHLLNQQPLDNFAETATAFNMTCGGTGCAACAQEIALHNTSSNTSRVALDVSSMHCFTCLLTFCGDCAELYNSRDWGFRLNFDMTRKCLLRPLPSHVIREALDQDILAPADRPVVSTKIQALVTQIQKNPPFKR